MTDSIFQLAADLEREGKPGVLCTIVHSVGATPRHTASKMIVLPGGNIIGTIGGGELETRVIQESLQAIKDQKTRLIAYDYNNPSNGGVGVCGGKVEVYLEPIAVKPQLLVVGAGHVGKALAFLAHWLGYRVVVADDREEFATKEMAPQADECIYCPVDQISKMVKIDENTFIIYTTRSNELDIIGLPTLVDLPWAYLGVIGSKRRWALTVKNLQEKGLLKTFIDKIHSPIGLEIHAETPEEIAVSVMAEIIQLRNTRE